MKLLLCFIISLNIYALDCSKTYTPQDRKYQIEQNIELTLSSKTKENNKLLFHSGPGVYGSYVSLDIPFSPVEDLFKQLKTFHPTLKNRGEGHITVLTPVEFHCIFRPQGVTINDLEKAIPSDILTDYKILSIGNGHKGEDETFFIIVESNDLLNLRKVFSALLKDPSKFNHKKFYPHITLGFTTRDLHESDGVFKNEQYSKDSRFKLIVK
jgi:hypothetical protein